MERIVRSFELFKSKEIKLVPTRTFLVRCAVLSNLADGDGVHGGNPA